MVKVAHSQNLGSAHFSVGKFHHFTCLIMYRLKLHESYEAAGMIRAVGRFYNVNIIFM